MSDTPRLVDLYRAGCDLQRELNAANDRIRLLIAERDTARQQSDQKVSLREEFRELLGTDDIEQGITVVCDLKQLAAVRLSYIKQLEEQLMDAKNKHAVLVADVVLNEDRAERIKRLEETLDKTTKIASQRIKRLEDSYAAKDAQLSNLLNICRANGIDVSSQDLIHGKEDKL